ncbi:MFS transporter [Patescibacteria group bacterium]
MKTSFITILRNREFSKLWLAQLISVLVANMLNFILIGKVFEVTGSSIAIGFLWSFYVLPTVILGPFSGVILDYLDKKKILFYSSFVQAFVVLLYLGVEEKVWFFYSIILLYSFCDEFFMPALAVLLPSVVKKKELPIANSLFLFTTSGSIVIGFLFGGLLLKLVGYSEVLYMVASVLLFASALLVGFLNWKEPKQKKKLEVSLAGFYKELSQGYRFIKNEPRVLFPMILLAGLQVLLGMGLILLPSLSREILSIEFADSSYFVVVPGVLGLMFGGVMVERFLRHRLKRYLIINGLGTLGLAVLFIGLFLPLVWFKLFVGALVFFILGFAFMMMFIPLQLLIQENTPFNVRGRVFGTLNTLVTVAAALPVFATATLVDAVGVKLVIVFTGLGLIALAFYAKGGKYGIIRAYHRS